MLVKNTTYFFFILLISSAITGCKKSPNYSVVPAITFENLRVVHDYVNYTDSVSITIGFQDGNGDIGNYPTKPNFIDYYVDIYKKTNGVFVRMTYFDTSPLGYNGYLPLLSPYNVTGPIDGTITNIVAPFDAPLPIGSPAPPTAPFQKDDTIKFHVQIRDRANNYSNWVETTEYVVWGAF
jgi:hypothetical protein